MGTRTPHSLFFGSGEILTVLFGEEFVGARRASLRSHICGEPDNGTVNGTTTTGVVPVFRPVFLDSAPRFANVLEISATEVFMLLNVEPEV